MPPEPNDMSGKRVMITGCTAGLGRSAALALAEQQASLELVCRDRSKGEALVDEIERKTGRTDCELRVGDMGRMDDIRQIAASFLETRRPLDVLFNNAGVVLQQRTLTADGIEATFGVNHLGYFLLTLLLVPRLVEAPAARIVSTASDAYKFAGGRLDFDNLQGERRYSTFGAYGASKLANILFTNELARRLRATKTTANAFHPGTVGTDFGKNNGRFARFAAGLLKPFARSPEKGAETGVYLCTSPRIAGESGGYYYDCAIRKTGPAARNEEDARRLWEISEEMTGAGWPLDD